MKYRVVKEMLVLLQEDKTFVEASKIAVEMHWNDPSKDCRPIVARQWMNSFLTSGEIPAHRQGKHAKRLSILSDPDIKERCVDWIRSQKATHRSIPALRNFIRDNVFSDTLDLTEAEDVGMENTVQKTNHSLSNDTLSTYMKQWRFNYREEKDQVYFDEHERPDVVESEGEVPVQPELRRDEKKMVLVTHDESIFYFNDWQGKSIMVGSFMCP
ncbi:hypothetical protein G6F56_009540 [Rhizopus delemar]|nr:hypothetical protein G6F56_009540 [Rhizopus delemar]